MTLSPETRRLLDRAREQSEPTDEDRRNIRRRVAAVVTLTAASGVSAAAASEASAGTIWSLSLTKLVVGVALVGGLGTAGYLALHSPSEPEASVPAPSLEPAVAPAPPGLASASAPAAAETAGEAPVEVAPAASRRAPPQPSAAPGASTLQDELHAIRRARAQLDADPDAALEVLDALPAGSGQLAVEREGLAVAARCRRDPTEHIDAARRFLAQHGSSPGAQAVRSACGLP